MEQRCLLEHDPFLQRRAQQHHLVRLQSDERLKNFGVPLPQHFVAELGQTDQMIGFKHVAYLLPGDVHVLLLILLNHSGTKPAGHTKSWIEI